MNDLSRQIAFGWEPDTSPKFDTLTPIAEVNIPAMTPHLEDKIFASYEELHYYLQCQNPMCLSHALKHISNTWQVDGMGSTLKLLSLNNKGVHCHATHGYCT